MITIAYFYLVLPTVMFLFGWLKTPYAIILVISLLLSMYVTVRDFEQVEFFKDYYPLIRNAGAKTLMIVFVVLLWVGFSGIGGFAFQNSDFTLRNAVFRDLISFHWPVIYSYTNQQGFVPYSGHEGGLVYYLSYWLPAALVGKFFGWHIANVALYVWTVIGVLLTLYLLFRYLKKSPIILTIILIFWSGLDIVGTLLKGHFPALGEHIEWWAGLYQYSSNTTTLFWVFNQTIPVWVIIMLMMNQKNTKSILFTYALAFPFAPFPCIGLAPFVFTYMFFGPMSHDDIPRFSRLKSIVFSNLKQTINVRNFVVAPLIIIVFFLYYTSNHGNLGSSGISSLSGENGAAKALIRYFAFILLEFGVYSLLIIKYFRRNPWFIIAIISLILIPNYHAGVSNDFVMRSSIPALIILMIYVSTFLFQEVKTRTSNRAKIFLVISLFLGAITPVQEISRSIEMTLLHPNHQLIYDLGTLSILDATRSDAISLYVSNEPKKSLFFKYLAK